MTSSERICWALRPVRTAEVVLEFGDDLVDHADCHAEAAKPIKRGVVADRGHGAAGIGDDIHVVAKPNGVPGRPEQTDVGGQARENQVGAARGLQRGGEVRVDRSSSGCRRA